MDKLAPAIGWIKKNYFWLSSGLLLVSMVGIWFYQTNLLGTEQEKNVRDIDSKFKTALDIKSKKPDDLNNTEVILHPNRTTKEGMTAELENTVESILEAWRLRVEAQKELLVFPAVIGQKKFNDVFAQYNPPETFPAKYADFQIDALLSLYRVKVKDHMINIAGKDGLKTNWRWDPENYEQDERKIGGGLGGMDGGLDGGMDGGLGGGLGGAESAVDEDESRFAVIWSETNQKLWQDKLTQFQGRDDHGKESNDPTPLQCYMLQQDLWLLEAMFRIIRGLNGDSVSTDTSAIKQIDHIAIGREGNAKLGKLHPVDARLGPQASSSDDDETTGGAGGDPMGDPMGGLGGLNGGASSNEKHFTEDDQPQDDGFGGGGMGPSGMDGGGDGDEAAMAVKHPPFHEMYVDKKLEPIPAEEVLAVVSGDQIPENQLELLIAKRVPVRVGLKMDERKIADFMAACANSPFAFEIQQVRINRHQEGGEFIELAGGGDASGGVGMGGGLDGGFGGGLGSGLGGFEGGLGGGAGGESTTGDFDKVEPIATRTNFDVRVEFFGIVKIYNPVREDLLRQAVGLPVDGDEPIGQDESGETVEAAAGESNNQGRLDG